MKKLCVIGKQTMAIYLLHLYLVVPVTSFNIDISGFRSTVILILLLLVSFIVSLICVKVYELISYFPVLNYILFGKKKVC